MKPRLALWLAALLALASAAPAAVLVLTNGDRVTGKITLRGKTSIRVRTPYGSLLVPRTAIATIENDDGRREVLNAPPTPVPTPLPAPPRLEVRVRGDAFWYAWDPKALPASTAVTLRLRLEDEVLGAYTDDAVDPGEIRGAVVNAFAFTQDVVVQPGTGVTVESPTADSGAVLELTLPPGSTGGLLRVSYLVRPGPSDDEPVEVASGTVRVRFAPGRTTRVNVRQDRGAMEWSKRQVSGAATFGIQADPAAPDVP